MVEHEGEYEFCARQKPTAECERPDFERAEKSSWRVTLSRGQKTWVVLSNQWPGETGHERSAPRLRRGAYQITITYSQPAPDFSVESQVRPHHTGFEVKYAGPDSHGRLVALPVKHLYRESQTQTLGTGITFLPKKHVRTSVPEQVLHPVPCATFGILINERSRRSLRRDWI